MGTVASSVTRINDIEGSLTASSIGGGPGAGSNTDIFLQASQSIGRRMSNVTLGGYFLDNGVGGVDLSGAGTHVGMWVWMTHYSSLTDLRLRLADTAGVSDYDEHTFALTEFPSLGGWVRVWINLARTPEAIGGTGLILSSVRYYGVTASLVSVGGNADNLIMDAIDHTTTGLTVTGASSVFQDFLTADEDNATNKYGVVISLSGIIYCKARLTIGSGTATTFTDSAFTVIFPQQNLVAATFMGLTIDLSNASTAVTLSSGTLGSPGLVKGDLIVSGTSGTLVLDGMSCAGLRAVTFTSACTVTATAFNACNTTTQAGADISTSTFTDTLLLADDPDLVATSTFTSTGAGGGHGMEVSVTGEYTLTDLTWTSFGASGSTDAAIYNNSAGELTLNLVGGTTPTYRNGTSASTILVASPATLTLTNIVSGSEVRLSVAGGTGIADALYGVETTDGVVDPAYVYTATGLIDIVVHNIDYQYFRLADFPLSPSDASLPISQVFDRNYENP
jgi:hypothetical protein